MEFTIKYHNGVITLREPFFPVSKRRLTKHILPLLLEDYEQGEETRKAMADYCEEQYNSMRYEVKAYYRDGMTKREKQHLNGMVKKAMLYKTDMEVLRG